MERVIRSKDGWRWWPLFICFTRYWTGNTGASVVTLPQAVATSAGLRCLTQVTMRTGNGHTRACTTIIQKLRFGNFTLREVEAVIAPNLDQPLLGMNVLKRFRVEQDGGQMRLSKKY
jgi:aspartyl protease family protein